MAHFWNLDLWKNFRIKILIILWRQVWDVFNYDYVQKKVRLCLKSKSWVNVVIVNVEKYSVSSRKTWKRLLSLVSIIIMSHVDYFETICIKKLTKFRIQLLSPFSNIFQRTWPGDLFYFDRNPLIDHFDSLWIGK